MPAHKPRSEQLPVPTVALGDVLDESSPSIQRLVRQAEGALTGPSPAAPHASSPESSASSTPDSPAEAKEVAQQPAPEASAETVAVTTAFQDIFRLVLILLGIAYALTCTSCGTPRTRTLISPYFSCVCVCVRAFPFARQRLLTV